MRVHVVLIDGSRTLTSDELEGDVNSTLGLLSRAVSASPEGGAAINMPMEDGAHYFVPLASISYVYVTGLPDDYGWEPE